VPLLDQQVQVRRAGAVEAGVLVAMCGEHARYERAAYDPTGKAGLLEKALSGRNPRLLAWIAEAKGTAIGYAAATPDFSTWSANHFLHMDCLFVREGHRGRGVGAAMMDVLVDFARQTGYSQLQWQTPDWNTDAERFYLRRGAAVLGKLRFTLQVT
jgi:GNAT superfamily N-acetyltransferase